MGLLVPILAAIVLISIVCTSKKRAVLALPLFLILAGGVSNYIDVLRFGYVRDPLAIGSFVFNIADIGIGIGIIWAILVYTKR